MGYLDNSVVTVDAILTTTGRQLLAQGNFNITNVVIKVGYDFGSVVDFGYPLSLVPTIPLRLSVVLGSYHSGCL